MTDFIELLRNPPSGTDIPALLERAAHAVEVYQEQIRLNNEASAERWKRLDAEIDRLRAEIASLRQVSGCVDIPLKTFSDIKKEIKHG